MATLTTNKNYLQPTGFKVVINRTNYPNLTFFAQSVSHPDVSLTSPNVPYSRIGNVSIPGDALDYSQLNINFILDEDMEAYTELYNWMESLVNINFKNTDNSDPSQADISISILTSHNNQNKVITYKGCNPVSVSGLELTAIASTVEYLTFNGVFTFTGFEIKS